MRKRQRGGFYKRRFRIGQSPGIISKKFKTNFRKFKVKKFLKKQRKQKGSGLFGAFEDLAHVMAKGLT